MRRLLLALAALALSAVALAWAPAPLLWIAALWLAVAVAAAATARSPRGRLVAVHVAAAIAAVGGFEAYLWLDAGGAGPDVVFEGTYRDGGYFVDHEILGYAPRPGITVRSAKRIDGEPVYDVTYSIGADGLRSVPAPAIPAPRGSVVFFGCSVTFGEGLEDRETLPALVAGAVSDRFRVYNFGFHGYGPHQMLAAIESGLFDEIVHEPPVAVFYTALGHHVERAAGRVVWDHNGPRYRLREDGTVERIGRLGERPSASGRALHERLERIRLYRQTLGSERAITPADVALTAGIVRTARDRIRAAHPDAAFHVLLWGRRGDGRAERLGAALVQAGLTVHWIRDLLPGYEEDPLRFQLSRFDQHPNRAAQPPIAAYVVEALGDPAGDAGSDVAAPARD